MAATPASSARRRARVTPSRSPGRWPGRSLTVTGRPLPRAAARASATARSGSASSAAPAPVLHTLGTGQPMLRSMTSAPASATVSAAEAMTSGSLPKSWIEIGPGVAVARSSGWMRRSSRMVFSLRWWIACEETISDTVRPAPKRRACRRTHQFPIPARGASTTRLGTVSGPRAQESVSFGLVELMDDPQPLEGEQIIHRIDALAERDDHVGQPARGDHRGLLPHLRAQPPDDPVDLPGVAVDDARPDRVDGRLADQRAWFDELDPGQPGGALGQGLERDLHARGDQCAEQRAVVGDHVVGDGGAEVDDDAGGADAVEGGDGVDEAVGAELARVVDADGHPGPHAGPDDHRVVVEVAPAHALPLDGERRDGRGDDRPLEVVEGHAVEA